MPSSVLPGFLPSTNGFHFANRFPSAPAFSVDLGLVHLGIGNAAYGLCGGMCFAVRDRFERGEPVAPDTAPPGAGMPLFAELARRQLDSFGSWFQVPFAFWRAAVTSQRAREARTLRREWPRIRAEIESGHLAMVGILRTGSPDPRRLGRNHQVAAYAYQIDGAGITLRVYDPNHPDRDDVSLRIERAPATPPRLRLSQSTGESVVGLLALPFTRR